MQSSATAAGRALIMLACVVGIPVLALSGTSWSDMVKKLQEFHWPAILNLASASNSATAATPPAKTPRIALPSGDPAPLCQIPADASALPKPTTSAQPSPVVPVGYQSPVEPGAIQPSAVRDGGENATAASFRGVQDRLRQLGAKYYLLESWGSQQQVYRFYCKMAIGGSTEFTRCFEATNSDPLQAMVDVLRQVETQRDGGQTAQTVELRADAGGRKAEYPDLTVGH
jgi:hypothetical protein